MRTHWKPAWAKQYGQAGITGGIGLRPVTHCWRSRSRPSQNTVAKMAQAETRPIIDTPTAGLGRQDEPALLARLVTRCAT